MQPQAPNQMRRAVEVNIDEDLLIHLRPRFLALWLGFLCAPWTKIDPFRQTLFFQRKANLVGFRAGKFAEPVEHPKRKQHGGVGSYPYTWITLFHLH
jgi:hypothetical protein